MIVSLLKRESLRHIVSIYTNDSNHQTVSRIHKESMTIMVSTYLNDPEQKTQYHMILENHQKISYRSNKMIQQELSIILIERIIMLNCINRC